MNMTTMNSVQPMAPPPYFDDDDMLNDYIDDDDFGGPPPPTTEGAGKASRQHDNLYDENYWEDMMEMEMEIQGQREKEQEESGPVSNSTTAGINTHDSIKATESAPPTAIDTLSGENEKENANWNENLNDDSNNNTVEEYLAARRQDNDLFNFERYTKNRDWRIKSSVSASNQQQQSQRRQRLVAFSLLSKKNSGNSSDIYAKTVAPEARFLRLLEANHGGQFYNQNNNSDNSRGKTQKLWLTQRSSNGGNTNVFRSPPKADHVPTVPMTLADGSRVHIRCSAVRKRNDVDATTEKPMTAPVAVDTTNKKKQDQSAKSCVLGVSMKELYRRVDGMRRDNIIAARRRIQNLARLSNTKIIKDENGGNIRDDMLWVDKHAPKSFPQLLSDERTNREVLRALRGWDPYVFRKAPPLRPLYQRQREQDQREEQNAKVDNNKSTNTTKKQTDKTQTNRTSSSDKRPEENARVILLSGPPGVGKTTLAHIVARHAGYRPVEVNASDERSSTVLKDRIERAMESTTINFKPDSSSSDKRTNDIRASRKSRDSNNDTSDYGKPNCLILDEIDGADARGSIQVLVDIVKAGIPSKNDKQKQTTTTTYLKRPIICICNHKYAPALRPLLPYAAHFNVESPSSARLVSRLKAILNEEEIPMLDGGSLLHQLVVSTGGDIRSCLFTLQFASAESKDAKDLSEALTNSLSGTGLKDNRNDITSTITTVFRKPQSGPAQFSTHFSSSSSRNRDRASVSHLMNAADSFKDDSTAVNALFMNIVRVSYIDPTFDRCSAAHDLLSFAAYAQHQQSAYAVPVVMAGIHLLCRVEVKPKLTFSSRELSDVKYRRDSNLGLVQKFCEGLPTTAKNLKCISLLSEEFIPLAVWVLSAGDGPASLCRAASSIEILTNKEQNAAKRHIAALCGLGLTYVVDREQQERQAAGSAERTTQIEMRLEPPIHRLVDYSSMSYPDGMCRREIPSKMKELLAHQVLLERFQSHDLSTSGSSMTEKKLGDKSREIPATSSSKLERKDESSLCVEKVTPKKSDHLNASMKLPIKKDLKSTPSPNAGNFLGIAAQRGKAAKSARRAAALGLDRSSSKKRKLAHSGSGFLLQHVVRMKYVKGFTQAVRTPCRLKDLD